MNAVRALAANVQPTADQDDLYEALVMAGVPYWVADAATTAAFTNDNTYLRNQIQAHTGLKIYPVAK